MPAVTVDDLTVLPRLHGPGLGDTVRPVVSVTTAPRGFEGEGFPVRRAFAGVDLSLLDPFVHMDQMGEVEYAPGEPKGTPWHPHRGFETVTYMIDGVMDHQDSQGGGGSITNGDTQWMTAGSGMLHIETPPEWLVSAGGLFHGIQLWVNLPRDQKWATPRYQDLRSSQLGLVTTADAGALVRVIAGDVGGHAGPGSTHTPMAMVHASLAPGARLDLPWQADFNALVYVLAGSGSVGLAGAPGPGRTAGGPRPGRLRHPGRRPAAGERRAEPRGAGARRPSDPRAGRLGRPVRDEHQGRGAPGLRGLPEGPDGAGPGRARSLQRRRRGLSPGPPRVRHKSGDAPVRVSENHPDSSCRAPLDLPSVDRVPASGPEELTKER